MSDLDPGAPVVLLVMTDGRGEYLTRTLAAFDRHVTANITARLIHDDSGDVAYRAWLGEAYPQYRLVTTGRQRCGFSAAMCSAWRHLVALRHTPWVFHLEDDFEVTRPVNLADLAALLVQRPYLAQMALRRQAWGTEVDYGGFVEAAPAWYSGCTDGTRSWIETGRNFTCNPSLYRRSLTRVGWPLGDGSENLITSQLRKHGLPWGVPGPRVRFGFWGDLPGGRDWVHHIGHRRMGVGY